MWLLWPSFPTSPLQPLLPLGEQVLVVLRRVLLATRALGMLAVILPNLAATLAAHGCVKMALRRREPLMQRKPCKTSEEMLPLRRLRSRNTKALAYFPGER